MKKPLISLFFVALAVLALTGCKRRVAEAEQVSSSAQCAVDTQCKGDRICENGKCISPGIATPAAPLVAPAVVEAPAVPAPALNPMDLAAHPVTVDGLGKLKVGMTAKQVKAAGFRFKNPEYGEISECAQVEMIDQNGIGLLFENDQVARIEVSNKSTSTPSGARVGDSESKIRKLYAGRLKSIDHEYIEGGHYLVIESGGGMMVFDTDGKVVNQIRVGPAAGYVEGCL